MKEAWWFALYLAIALVLIKTAEVMWPALYPTTWKHVIALGFLGFGNGVIALGVRNALRNGKG